MIQTSEFPERSASRTKTIRPESRSRSRKSRSSRIASSEAGECRVLGERSPKMIQNPAAARRDSAIVAALRISLLDGDRRRAVQAN